MGKLTIDSTPLNGLVTVRSAPFIDHRGAFFRCFCDDELGAVIGDRRIRQVNHSRTEQVGALRGMHFQTRPHGEMKLVRCLRGRVWDVAVDLRKGSPTLLRWYGVELTDRNYQMMVIPEGFAHGFQVLEPSSELLYLHTHPYTPSAEAGVRYDDSKIGITWPLPAVDVSGRDKSYPALSALFDGI